MEEGQLDRVELATAGGGAAPVEVIGWVVGIEREDGLVVELPGVVEEVSAQLDGQRDCRSACGQSLALDEKAVEQ